MACDRITIWHLTDPDTEFCMWSACPFILLANLYPATLCISCFEKSTQRSWATWAAGGSARSWRPFLRADYRKLQRVLGRVVRGGSGALCKGPEYHLNLPRMVLSLNSGIHYSCQMRPSISSTLDRLKKCPDVSKLYARALKSPR